MKPAGRGLGLGEARWARVRVRLTLTLTLTPTPTRYGACYGRSSISCRIRRHCSAATSTGHPTYPRLAASAAAAAAACSTRAFCRPIRTPSGEPAPPRAGLPAASRRSATRLSWDRPPSPGVACTWSPRRSMVRGQRPEPVPPCLQQPAMPPSPLQRPTHTCCLGATMSSGPDHVRPPSHRTDAEERLRLCAAAAQSGYGPSIEGLGGELIPPRVAD